MVGRHWTLVLGLACVSTAALPAGAAAQRWEELGSRRVRLTAERDVIDVGATDGLFTAIRIEADGDIEMFNIRVVFADGSDFSPNTRVTFREGTRSRVIDLPGAARAIRRVSFAYRRMRAQAVVRLFGRRRAARCAGTRRLDVARQPLRHVPDGPGRHQRGGRRRVPSGALRGGRG
jgi:hypothetical protein